MLVCIMHVTFMLKRNKAIPSRLARLFLHYHFAPFDRTINLKLPLKLRFGYFIADPADEKRLESIALGSIRIIVWIPS